MAETASPDVRNYSVGKGIPYFKPEGESTFQDMGNATAFDFTPTLETLDHFSNRTGVKTKDRSVTLSYEGELKLTLEEFTILNLGLVMSGTSEVNSAGQAVISIGSRTEIKGAVKFTGTNKIGPRWEWLFPNVSFKPSGSVSALSDEWGSFEVTGQVLADENGVFGTLTRIGGEEEADSSS